MLPASACLKNEMTQLVLWAFSGLHTQPRDSNFYRMTPWPCLRNALQCSNDINDIIIWAAHPWKYIWFHIRIIATRWINLIYIIPWFTLHIGNDMAWQCFDFLSWSWLSFGGVQNLLVFSMWQSIALKRTKRKQTQKEQATGDQHQSYSTGLLAAAHQRVV